MRIEIAPKRRITLRSINLNSTIVTVLVTDLVTGAVTLVLTVVVSIDVIPGSVYDDTEMVSIVILSHKRLVLLERLLASIQSIQLPFAYEILIFSNDEEAAEFSELNRRFAHCPGVRLFRTRLLVGEARNVAVGQAQYPWICFLDDDVYLPRDYFETAANLIHRNPDITVFGGPDQTPPQSSAFQSAVGVTLTSPWATGKTRHRHFRTGTANSPADESKLILCNLWMRRSLFQNHGGTHRFDSRLIRNEENLLLHAIRAEKWKLLYCPDLFVFHERRHALRGVFWQAFRSGLCRIESFKKDSSSFEFCYLIPAVFLFTCLALLCCLSLPFSVIGALIYLLALSAVSSALIRARTRPGDGRADLGWVIITHAAIHLAYGLGSWVSLLGLYNSFCRATTGAAFRSMNLPLEMGNEAGALK